MIENKFLVEKTDKEQLIELMNEACSILEKYKYLSTALKIKGLIRKARESCDYLVTKK